MNNEVMALAIRILEKTMDLTGEKELTLNYDNGNFKLCIDEENEFIDYEISGHYMNKEMFLDYLVCAVEESGEYIVKQNMLTGNSTEVFYTASLGGRKCDPMDNFTRAHLIDFDVVEGKNAIYRDFSVLLK